METTNKPNEVIDLRDVFKSIKSHRKLFVKVWIITFILSCAYILPIPRSYTTSLSLAPEVSSETQGGSLASLASTFGVNLGSMSNNDAFYPELYPDVIATNTFIVDLFPVKVCTIDGEIETDYYTYLTRYNKKTFYKIPLTWLRNTINNILEPKKEGGDGVIDPLRLSVENDKLVEAIRNKITCNVDKRTSIITISVEDQDPLICKTMADTVMLRLQKFITMYRTQKARIDMEHYKALADSALTEYTNSLEEYSRYSDTHFNSVMQAYISEQEKKENEVNMKFTTYNALNTQYEAAKAKVQERTPAFTILEAASVPVKPTHPKRMMFVIAMLFLSTIGTGIKIFWNDIKKQLTHIK